MKIEYSMVGYIFQCVLIIISIGITLYKSGVLKAQIKAQEQTLNNYVEFMEAFDISKFKEYSSIVEELGVKKMEVQKLELDKKMNEENIRYKEHYSKYFNEMAHYVVWSLGNLKVDRSEKLKIAKEVFPISYPIIEGSIK